MKDLKFLIWLTQLGISVAAPLAGFVLLSVWLRSSFSLGNWVIWVGVLFGVICAVDGLRNSLKSMNRMVKQDQPETPPPIAFNDHT